MCIRDRCATDPPPTGFEASQKTRIWTLTDQERFFTALLTPIPYVPLWGRTTIRSLNLSWNKIERYFGTATLLLRRELREDLLSLHMCRIKHPETYSLPVQVGAHAIRHWQKATWRLAGRDGHMSHTEWKTRKKQHQTPNNSNAQETWHTLPQTNHGS